MPVPYEVGAGRLHGGELGQAAKLVAIADPAVVLAPARLLSVAEQVLPGDVVVVPGLGATEAGRPRMKCHWAVKISSFGALSDTKMSLKTCSVLDSAIGLICSPNAGC